jgi:hypothetical protein
LVTNRKKALISSLSELETSRYGFWRFVFRVLGTFFDSKSKIIFLRKEAKTVFILLSGVLYDLYLLLEAPIDAVFASFPAGQL